MSYTASSRHGASSEAGGAGSRSKRSMCSSELSGRVEAVRIQLEEERKRRLDVEEQIQNFVLEKGGPKAAAVQKIITEADLRAASSSSADASLSSIQRLLAGARKSTRTSGGSRNGGGGGDNDSERGSVRSSATSSSSVSSRSSGAYQQHVPRNLPPIETGGGGADLEYQQYQQQQQQQQKKRVPTPANATGIFSNNNNNSISSKNRHGEPKSQQHIEAQQHQQQDIVTKCESEAAECERLLRQLNHSHATVLSRKPALPQAARGITRKPGAAGCDYIMARRMKATPAQLYVMQQAHQTRVDKIQNFTLGVAGNDERL